MRHHLLLGRLEVLIIWKTAGFKLTLEVGLKWRGLQPKEENMPMSGWHDIVCLIPTMGYSSKTTRKEPLIQRCFSINMKIIEPSIGDHQCCEDLVVALRRWSHARIVPKGSLFFSFYFKKRSVHNYVTVWHEIFAGFSFADWQFFVFCGNLFFRLGQIGFAWN